MAGLLTAAQITDITATVASSLDQSLPLYRPTMAQDSYGHNGPPSYPGSPTATIACNISKPSASMLQAYAGIIGSQRALTMRVMSTTDVREGDRVVCNSLNWQVQNILNAESYSVANEYLITTVT